MVATDTEVQLIAMLLRIDTDADMLKIIRAYVSAAESWLRNAGVEPDYGDGLYTNAVAAYVGQQYDNPECVAAKSGGAAKSGDVTLTAMTEQLRLAQAAKQQTGGDAT